MSPSCASLVSPLVTKTVDPDWSVSAEASDRNFQLLSNHLALFNKRLCHPLLIYCPSPFSCVLHSTGNYSIIFAQILWPESVIQIPWGFFIGSPVLHKNLNKSLWFLSDIKVKLSLCRALLSVFKWKEGLCKIRDKIKKEAGRRLRK